MPFPEKLGSLAYAGDADHDAGVLVLGTKAGGLVLWEVHHNRVRNRIKKKLIQRSSSPQAVR